MAQLKANPNSVQNTFQWNKPNTPSWVKRNSNNADNQSMNDNNDSFSFEFDFKENDQNHLSSNTKPRSNTNQHRNNYRRITMRKRKRNHSEKTKLNNSNSRAPPNNMTFSFSDNKENQENNKDFTFSFSTPRKSKRMVKLPSFSKLPEIETRLDSLKIEISEQELVLQKLMKSKEKILREKKSLKNEIKTWYLNWKEWNEDDLIEFIFQIDNGYFKIKQNINPQWLVKDKFLNELRRIIDRLLINKNKNKNECLDGFRGKYLIYVDILDIKQLIPSIDSDDCRKLFKEIQKVTKSGNARDFSKECEICVTNDKEYVLSCGHLFCGRCVAKMENCAFCKKPIDKNKMIKAYL